MKFSFTEIWNAALDDHSERELTVRSHIWASEIGGAYIDRYLKMRGVKPSTPPNARSLRKFEAGNIFEWIVGLILKRSGLHISGQDRLEHQYEGLLNVTGKCDFIVGGIPDFDKAKYDMKSLQLPDLMNRAAMELINHLEITLGCTEFEKRVLEIKSCADMMFRRYEAIGKPNSNHVMQGYHYKKCTGLPVDIIYINKDCLLMKEFEVTDAAETLYKADIERMTDYIENDYMPDKEKEILFDKDVFKFQTNWKVEYSNYLEYLYGYTIPDEYRERWKKLVSSFNRTFKRCVKGDKMTDLNKKTIEEAVKVFPDWDKYVEMAKNVNLPDEPEEE